MTQAALLDRLEADLRAVLEALRLHFVKAPEEALRLRPTPEAWNSLECFAHLNQELGWYLPKIELAIHKAKARRWTPQDRVRYSYWGERDLRRIDPANGRLRKTGKRRNFHLTALGVEEVKTLIIHLEQLLRVVGIARQVDLNRPTLKRHFGWFGSYPLGNLLEYLTAHVQRHVRQARATQPSLAA